MRISVHDALLQVFDVEHGACALLTTPSPHGWRRMMIDCGHNACTGWQPGLHLRRLNVSSLDELVVTNYDEDHVSGFQSFQRNELDIEWLICNWTIPASHIRMLKRESGIGNGIGALTTAMVNYSVAPVGFQRPAHVGVATEFFKNSYPDFQDENDLSLVAFLSIRGINFLFPGDLECAGFEALLESNLRFQKLMSKIDVLIASHHGRRSGICPALFEKFGCAPKLVVISDDRHQYATQDTVDYYESKCSGIQGFRNDGDRKVLSTRCDGELSFSFQDGMCIVN
jgi:beta-lactamase superfamily II metal-dependent hydrolase